MNNISTMSNCPFCEEGILSRQTKNTEYKYKGHSQLLPQPGIYCSTCDEAILEPSDLKYNRIQLQSFKSKVDGLLVPQEVKRIRKSLGLKQGEAAKIFGGGHNAFSRYELGELAVPKSMSLLLKILDQHKEIRKEVNL